MKKLLLALTAGTAMLAAVPATAQPNTYNATGYGSASSGIDNRIAQLESRLQAGISAGTIDRAEARSLRQQLRQLARLERQYSRDGLTQEERRYLQQQVRYTRDQMRLADGGRSRFADWNDDEYYDRYANRGPASSRYQPVSEVCAQRSGLAGVIGAAFGSDNCLRVGERAQYGLSAVPDAYRREFPDTATHYHRYLDGKIVQIDSRSGVVTRMFDVY